MPFINDRLDHSKEQQERIRYQTKAARASRFKFDPDNVMASLRANIVGQEHILDAFQDMLFTIKADFSVAHKPLSVILLLGPTGVGKTESVRILAESILGDSNRLCRIDMNTLAQEHYSAALTGSPPGYVGSKEGQTLFDGDKITGSFSEPGIVLFDEIEKADKQVVRSIMNILDTGKLLLTSGVKEIDFSNTLIFMTSNLGAKELAHSKKTYSQGWRALFKLRPKAQQSLLDDALSAHFDPEFINRIDRILPFNWLDDDQLSKLVDLELSKLNNRLRARNASIHVDDHAKRHIISEYDIRYGARDISRRIRKELEPKIAKALLGAPDKTRFKVCVDARGITVQAGID